MEKQKERLKEFEKEFYQLLKKYNVCVWYNDMTKSIVLGLNDYELDIDTKTDAIN